MAIDGAEVMASGVPVILKRIDVLPPRIGEKNETGKGKGEEKKRKEKRREKPFIKFEGKMMKGYSLFIWDFLLRESYVRRY